MGINRIIMAATLQDYRVGIFRKKFLTQVDEECSFLKN